MKSAFQHAVQFYQDDQVLCRTVAHFLGQGLLKPEPAIVIATPAHREAIAKALGADGIAIQELQQMGMLLMLDAEETLASFMAKDRPDSRRFQSSVGAIMERAAALAGRGTVRAYGEMVDVLWKRGNAESAIRLEVLWNDLATRFSFSLLCGYAMGSFYKETAALGYDHVCSQHTHLLSDAGDVIATARVN